MENFMAEEIKYQTSIVRVKPAVCLTHLGSLRHIELHRGGSYIPLKREHRAGKLARTVSRRVADLQLTGQLFHG